RHASSSSSSRDIVARSVRLISFRSGANRGGTQGVESHSRQTASPPLAVRTATGSPHSSGARGDVNGCVAPLSSLTYDFINLINMSVIPAYLLGAGMAL